jgi:putative intracellular protease/amidase
MLHGLEGRRIAVTMPDGTPIDNVAVIRDALMASGGEVEALTRESNDDAWHSGLYAALVVVGGDADTGLPKADPRLVQLVREFLVSEKPVAAIGTGVGVVIEAGGAAGRTLTADKPLTPAAETSGATLVDESVHTDGCLISARSGAGVEEFSRVVAKEFARQLEEEHLDEMSAQSFPASDPPATNPSVGAAGDADRRP